MIAPEQVRLKPDTRHVGWGVRAFAVYAVATVIFTWPLVLHPFSILASTEGPGDSYLNLWILGWDLQSITHHPASMLSGRVFEANIFYPAAGTLAYSDHLLLQALALLPLYLLTGNLSFCYNALLIASLIACALAMHAYVRELVGESPAAWIAGLAWGFAPYHFSHLIHLQLQALYWFPLTFLFLHRAVDNVEGRRSRDACLLGVTLAAQALSSVYYGVIGAFAVTAGALILMLGRDRRRLDAPVRRLLLAAVIGTVIVGPVALKYWWVQQREGFGRSLHEASQGSAVPRAYLEVPAVNLLYARTGLLYPHNAGDPLHKASEQNLFPGFMLCGLASIGAAIGLSAATGRKSRVATAMLLALVIAGFLLSLGPDGVRPLYASLYQIVFGFQAIRAPARFAVLVLFGLASLAALGVEQLLRHPRSKSPEAGQGAPAAKKRPAHHEARKWSIGAIVALLLAAEYLNAPIHYVPAPQIDTPPGRWLRAAPEPGAVVYLPLELDPSINTIFMVQSLAHGRPIVNGYSGERPAFFTALVDTMARFPSAEAVRTLLDLRVKFLVSPGPVDVAALPAGTLVERVRFSDSVVYELRESAELDSALTVPETPPLPEPVSIPFAIGEKAIYSVVWTSGPLSLPAGHITLEVRPGTNGARFDFAASGRTADLVSNFFEADDRYVSEVDDRLRSLTFEQHIKEGRRRLDRQMVFDRARRAVRVHQGSGPTISLPIPADALDPLAAFYYARALALSSRSTVLIPINDSNRNLVVELHVPPKGAAESIIYKGSRIEAVRATAQIRGRQGPLSAQIAIWFSESDTKLPVKAEISGIVGVGGVRLELESGQ